jgi:hypothetical protein
VTHIPFASGYDDHYIQTAVEWLIAQGHAPADTMPTSRGLRETLGGTYSVVDVARRRDL